MSMFDMFMKIQRKRHTTWSLQNNHIKMRANTLVYFCVHHPCIYSDFIDQIKDDSWLTFRIPRDFAQ